MRAHRTPNEEIADRCFDEFTKHGRLQSPDLQRLFRQKYVKPADQALREEVVYLVFDLLGRNLAQVATMTGLSTKKILRLVEVRTKRLYETPEGRERELQREEKLEEKRFQGRAEILDMCLEAGKAALAHARKEIPNMKGYEAARASVLFYKLAGAVEQQSRVPDAAGERLLDDETLETKAREYSERRQKLTLVDADDQASA